MADQDQKQDIAQPPSELTIEHTKGSHFGTFHASGAILTGSPSGEYTLTFHADVPEIVKEALPRAEAGGPNAYNSKAAKFDMHLVREEQCRVILSAATVEGLLQVLLERPDRENK